MMRSLYTAASGMVTQQQNVDTISHNLSNVNTTGFKKERLEFKSLLYDTINKASIDPEGKGTPVGLQYGHGVRPVVSTKIFTQGNLEITNNPLDISIQGPGFFTVKGPNDEIVYTKDGSFKTSLEDDGRVLVTSDGYRVLNTDDEPIIFPEEMSMTDLKISENGRLSYMSRNEGNIDLGINLKIVQFKNPTALEATGGNFLRSSGASGSGIVESEEEVSNKSLLMQGSLETSNVQVIEEMVKLIVAQRAYEVNSKAITTSDEMLGQANQLKK